MFPFDGDKHHIADILTSFQAWNVKGQICESVVCFLVVILADELFAKLRVPYHDGDLKKKTNW